MYSALLISTLYQWISFHYRIQSSFYHKKISLSRVKLVDARVISENTLSYGYITRHPHSDYTENIRVCQGQNCRTLMVMKVEKVYHMSVKMTSRCVVVCYGQAITPVILCMSSEKPLKNAEVPQDLNTKTLYSFEPFYCLSDYTYL